MAEGNGQEWARSSIMDIKEDVRGLRKEIAGERLGRARDAELIMLKMDSMTKQLSEMRGASKLAGALWGGMSGVVLAWLSSQLKR